jgi:hypothetical protein
MFNRWGWSESEIRNLTPRATEDYLEAMAEFNEERRRAWEDIEADTRR